jgi:zona occludens toxin
MIYLRTGLPGGGKTLNSLKEIVENPKYSTKQKFYNNIRLLMLDIDVCNSFSGWFYGVFYENTPINKRARYDKIIKLAHDEDRFVDKEDVPWLLAQFKCFTEYDALNLFLTWVRKLYPKEQVEKLDRLFELAEKPTVEDVKSLNYHFTYFSDATDWFNLPASSVIFIDESQQFFPVKPAGSKRPEHYAKFQTHRHKGYDIHLVTQDKGFIDFQVRSLANYHIHFKRPFTGKGIVRYEKDGIFNPSDKEELSLCKTKPMKRDSNFYGLYWSADEHTHEFKLPKMVLLLPVMFAIFGYLLYFMLSGEMMEVVTGKPNPIKSDESVPVLPASKSPVATSSSLDKFSYVGNQDFIHPLQDMCVSFEYGGYNTIKVNNIFQTEHFINCSTDEYETITSINDDGTSYDQQHLITRSLSSLYLKDLGYKIALNNRTPVIIYEKQKLFLRSF